MTDDQPRDERREERREARRQEILDAAMALIVEDGLDGLTVAKLARRLDAAVGALYRYFPGKPAVLTALQIRAISAYGTHLAERFDTLTARAEAAELAAAPRALAPLVDTFVAFLGHATTDPAHHRLFAESMASPIPLLADDLAREVDTSLRELVAIVARRFSAAVEAGALEPADPTERTFVVWSAVAGLDLQRKRDRIVPEALRSQPLAVHTARALLRGWGADAEAVDQAIAFVLAG